MGFFLLQTLDGTKSKFIECREQCSSKIEHRCAHIKQCPKLKATPVITSSGLKHPVPEPDSDHDDIACLPPPAKLQSKVQVAHELLLAKDPDLMAHLCSFQAEKEPFLKSLFHDSSVLGS